MLGGHAPFAILNRTGNRVVSLALHLPVLQGVAGSRLALVTVTGRRSGRRFTFPVAYRREGADRVVIDVAFPGRKRWWRNLRDPAPVDLRLAGETRTGLAQSIESERYGVRVEVALDPDSRSL